MNFDVIFSAFRTALISIYNLLSSIEFTIFGHEYNFFHLAVVSILVSSVAFFVTGGED